MMVTRSKYRYVIYLFISFVVHGSVMFLVEPTIEKKGTPIFVSWLDLLSKKDLYYTALFKEEFPKTLTARLLRSDYFLSYYFKDRMLLFWEDRGVFIEKRQTLTKKEGVSSLFLKKEQVPFIDLLDIGYRNLNYNVAITTKGRIGITSPLILPLNSAANLYLDEYLRGTALFFDKNKFYWTKVRVVIK